MRIRKYNGKDMQEALAKVRADLGVEAVILNSRKVKRRGIAAWFVKPHFEVLAAVEENFVPVPPRRGQQEPVGRKSDAWRESLADKAHGSRLEQNVSPVATPVRAGLARETGMTGIEPSERSGVPAGKPAMPRYGAAAYAATRDIASRESPPSEAAAMKPDELTQLKEQVHSMARMLERLQGVRPEEVTAGVSVKPAGTVAPETAEPAVEKPLHPAAVHTTSAALTEVPVPPAQPVPTAQPVPIAQPVPPVAEGAGNLPVVLERMRQRLLQQDIDTPLADRILAKVRALVPDNAGDEEIRRQTERVLLAALGEPDTIRLRQDGQPCVAAFIGPTGVGKTTTLAKIAADFSLVKGKKVGLITADTYRIAAVEQLKTYAEILNLPVTVVYAPSDMPAAIRAHQDKDLILIDTAGRSHRNRQQFDELRQLLSATPLDEVFLVLSANTGRAACMEVLERYSFVRDYKLLFTKLDETPVSGVIFNARLKTGKPLSYVTAGQSVPDDLSIADPRSLATTAAGLGAG
jgi:flagellar biosynthesis GTPase FlhF